MNSKVEDFLKLRVVTQDNTSMEFKIKFRTKLTKLINAYCEKAVRIYYFLNFNFKTRFLKGHSKNALRFRFDGQAITEADTPGSLGMQEGDIIEVYQAQIGGFLS